MMRPLSARERRMVALLILFALIAALHLAVVQPVLDGFAQRAAERERLQLRYVHNLRAIAAIPRLRRQAERDRAALTGYVADASTAEAGRDLLRDRLQRAVAQVGGALGESEDAEGRPGWARVRAVVRCSYPQLVALLGLLQRQPPWLVIESLSITGQEGAAGATPLLDVDLDVSVPLRAAALR
ncbi:hypothetical protein S2M10_33750 [Sphingomonas sp. S2M10]|nr:hypothetical protein [Sphingomonas sp. S2M10]